MNRKTEPLFGFLESCSSGATRSFLKLIKQCACHRLKRSLVQLRPVKVLSQHSHKEAPRIGCTLQPNLRTADIAAYTLNFIVAKPSSQSTPLKPFARHTVDAGGLDTSSSQHTSCPVSGINREVVGGLVPLRCATKVLSLHTWRCSYLHCIAKST